MTRKGGAGECLYSWHRRFKDVLKKITNVKNIIKKCVIYKMIANFLEEKN